jgi:hypothetical protein
VKDIMVKFDVLKNLTTLNNNIINTNLDTQKLQIRERWNM